MGFMGVPYKWGGNEAETGLDCSGFVRAVFRQITGIVLPRTSDRQAAATHSITVQELAPGDLVFFNTMGQPHSHVGIYIGDGKFVHAPEPAIASSSSDLPALTGRSALMAPGACSRKPQMSGKNPSA